MHLYVDPQNFSQGQRGHRSGGSACMTVEVREGSSMRKEREGSILACMLCKDFRNSLLPMTLAGLNFWIRISYWPVLSKLMVSHIHCVITSKDSGDWVSLPRWYYEHQNEDPFVTLD